MLLNGGANVGEGGQWRRGREDREEEGRAELTRLRWIAARDAGIGEGLWAFRFDLSVLELSWCRRSNTCVMIKYR